jgi:dTDP-4-dehydrorhamnose 3,5-epimerase
MHLNVRSLSISGVKLIDTARIVDARGYFAETYSRRDFAAHGINYDFLQDNQSASDAPGTIRGLHFQAPPFAQVKLIRVLSGRVFDVVVDLRCSSATYGKHATIELNETDGAQLLVPVGFAHGFCSLEARTVVLYKVDAPYSAAHDRGVNWADPALNIAWPVGPEEAILSNKDAALPLLSDLPIIFD